MAATLPRTDQRVGAQVVLGIGAATLAASGALAIAAFVMQSEALSIQDAEDPAPITKEEFSSHNTAVERRDDLIIAASVTGGAGAALLVAGLFLYLIDQPAVPAPPGRKEQPSESKPDEEPGPGIEVLAGPVLTPYVMGASVTGRF